MGLFSFRQELAIDLGTANTIIIKDGNIVLDEPSVISFDNNDRVIAVGAKANEMYEKGNDKIHTVRPLRNGVIADFNAAEQMIRGMINMITRRSRWFSPSLRMVVCIPSGSTEVEIRAVRDSSEHAGGRDVYMIHEPMAAAIGVGIDVLAPEGHMIVDIGGGTTEIAVISLGGIVTDESIRTAGDEFSQDIINYMRDVHKIKVGERIAEQIKIKVGAVYKDLENPPEDYEVIGADMVTTMPKRVQLSYTEIADCLEQSILKLETAILKTLQSSDTLYHDIYKNGVVLTGGGALLRGLDKRLTKRFGIEFKVAEDPLHSVAIGTGIALKRIKEFEFLIR